MHRNARSCPLDSYVIKGGEEGRARLGVIARVLAPTTTALLDRIGPIGGGFTVDAGCGGGDVSFLIAERVGPQGHVFGFDLDETKLALARAEAKQRGLYNLTFRVADVLTPWPIRNAQLVYMRFILTHLADPQLLLVRALQALAPGGILVAEDIDVDGRFWDPPCQALQRANELYKAVVRKNGGDPLIGRRLRRLFEEAGLPNVETALVQPFGCEGDAKETARLTFRHIADSVLETGIAEPDEIEALKQEIDAFTERSDSTISTPRIFQVWGRKP
jgi:ubiquinone/menaquinone biosynthesis C-methylase UbiE